MNRIYKVIWSRVKNCYVVVSEIANNRGKINGSGGTGVRTLLCALALVGSVALPLNVAQAVNPAGTGAGVAWGDGTDSGADQHNVAIGGYAKALGTVALSLGAHSESTGAYSTAVGGGHMLLLKMRQQLVLGLKRAQKMRLLLVQMLSLVENMLLLSVAAPR